MPSAAEGTEAEEKEKEEELCTWAAFSPAVEALPLPLPIPCALLENVAKLLNPVTGVAVLPASPPLEDPAAVGAAVEPKEGIALGAAVGAVAPKVKPEGNADGAGAAAGGFVAGAAATKPFMAPNGLLPLPVKESLENVDTEVLLFCLFSHAVFFVVKARPR